MMLQIVHSTLSNQSYFRLPCQLLNDFHLLLNDRILDWSKLKALANTNVHVTQKLIFVSKQVESIEEKEKMLVTSIFLFFHNAFKGILSQGCKKPEIVW